jgi:hypothetical protein
MIFRLGNKAGVGLTHCFSVIFMLMVLLKPVWLPASAVPVSGHGRRQLKRGEGAGGYGKVSDAV